MEEETDGGQGVGRESAVAETPHDGWGVGVEGSLGAVVAEGDGKVDPHSPAGELCER